MDSVFSTKETKELVVFIFKVASTLKEAKANDGKLDMGDLGLFFSLIPQMGPAFDSISTIPKELGDLSPEESAELQTLVLSEIGSIVGDQKVVIVIDKSLRLIHSAYELYLAIKA